MSLRKSIKTNLVAFFIIISFFLYGNSDVQAKTNFDKVFYDKELYYIAFVPENIEDIIFVFHGFGESPEDIIKNNNFPQQLFQQNVLVIIPSLKRTSFYFDTQTQNLISDIVDYVFEKYDLQERKYFLCGFSLGGTGAIKYAQNKMISNKIKGVIAIDPPLDLGRVFNSCLSTIKYSKNPISINESKYLAYRIKSEFKINQPSDNRILWENSAFSYNDTIFREDKLIDMPILIFSEPDINWQLTNRNRDIYDLNILDCSAYVNFLKTNGNENVILNITSNKGIRNGKRHPHSWSILDVEFTLEWIEKLMHK